MAEEDHNFRHGADRARVPQYTHHQYLGWQECDGGLKKMSRRHWFRVNSIQADPSQSLRWGVISGVHLHTHTPNESGANVTVVFKRFSMPATTVIACDIIFFTWKREAKKYTTPPLWLETLFSLFCEWSQLVLCHCSVSICLCRSCNTVVYLCGFLTRFNRCIYFIATSLGSSDVGFATRLLFP